MCRESYGYYMCWICGEWSLTMRLIDADALLESGICAEYGYNDNGLLLIPMRDVTNSIRNAPTIDAEPVRHGRWLYNSYPTVG